MSGAQQEIEQEANESETAAKEEGDIGEEVDTSEESTEPEILTAFDGKSPKIPSADFPNYLEIVEITGENWKNYFEVVYDEEWSSYELFCNAPIYDLTNLTLELKVIKEDSPLNGQMVDPKENYLVNSFYNQEGLEYTIDDFECVTAQGELIVGNVPEELWGTYDDDTVVYVGSNNGEQWMTVGKETSLGKFLD